MPRKHWLVKTEPDVFSIDDLLAAKDRTTGWGGVRNYQARNFLRDEMKRGDGVLVYHSSADPTAVVGEAEVAREGHPDPTQFDPRDKDHYDPDSKRDEPRWYQVEIRGLSKFAHPVTLARIKATPALAGMLLIKRGMRLSVQPVEKDHYERIVRMGKTGG